MEKANQQKGQAKLQFKLSYKDATMFIVDACTKF